MSPHEARRQGFAKALAQVADTAVVTDLVNIRYLTGFTGSNGAVLMTVDGAGVLATDGRYGEQAVAEAPGVEVVVTRDLAAELLRRATDAGARRVAVERHHLTVELHDRLVDAAPDVELVDGGRIAEELRIVKDEEELDLLARACAVTDEVFAATLPLLRPGVTEREIAWQMSREMHERDAEPAFPSIVAFGSNSARPHHRPTDRALEAGDLVKLDFGALVGGYHADMTRTVVLGEPAPWQRELHDTVREIQAEARAATVVGAVPVELDTAVGDRIRAAGYDVAHGLGHGVGLEIHESPFLVPGSSAARLAERVPVTVEPGVYLPGRGGVRIEDTVVVRAEGAVPLTRSPRELLVI